MYVWEETFVTRAFDPWTAASLVVLAAMLHGVWRLWRGMRIDAFQRDLRTMRQQPQTSIVFPGFRAAESSRTGFFQISLLPLMLASSGLAMLLAQAQRPDDLSRPLTWALFVGVGAWYGIRAWPNRRGVGPLRNFTWAGVYSAVILSAGLWAFYLAVDLWWGNGIGRLNSSFSVLLWWTAVGGFAGGLIGAFRANLVYGRSRTEVSPAKRAAPPDAVDLAIAVAPRKRRLAWGAIAMACFASFLIHCSTVPHLSRVVKYKWYWHDHYVYEPTNTINLLALPTPTPDDNYVSVQLKSSVALPRDLSEITTVQYEVAPPPPQDDPPPAEILVATLTKAVAANTQITANMVKLAPYAGATPGVIDDASQVVGMYTRVPITSGQPLLKSQLVQADLVVLGFQNGPVLGNLELGNLALGNQEPDDLEPLGNLEQFGSVAVPAPQASPPRIRGQQTIPSSFATGTVAASSAAFAPGTTTGPTTQDGPLPAGSGQVLQPRPSDPSLGPPVNTLIRTPDTPINTPINTGGDAPTDGTLLIEVPVLSVDVDRRSTLPPPGVQSQTKVAPAPTPRGVNTPGIDFLTDTVTTTPAGISQPQVVDSAELTSWWAAIPTREIVRTIQRLTTTEPDSTDAAPQAQQPVQTDTGEFVLNRPPQSQPPQSRQTRATMANQVVVTKTDGAEVKGTLLTRNQTEVKLQTSRGVLVILLRDIDKIEIVSVGVAPPAPVARR
jgi:hypothetical protein